MSVAIPNCQARVRSPKVQSPTVKIKRTWADTIITWATTPPTLPTQGCLSYECHLTYGAVFGHFNRNSLTVWLEWSKSHKLNYDFWRIEYFGGVRQILSKIATGNVTFLNLLLLKKSSIMSVLRSWDDLDSPNEEKVTVDETSYWDLEEYFILCYK